MSALATAYAMNVRATISLGGISAIRRSAFYAAEAGLNVGITNFANTFQNSGIPHGLDFTQTLAIADKTTEISMTESEGCAPCPPTRIPDGEVFGGLNTIPYRYVVQSTSEVPPGDSSAHVAGEFDIHNIPIFQFLAFIDSHLFVMPLPDMTLHGRLHTNSDLYMQPDNTLRVQDAPPDVPNVQITSAGDIYRGGRKYNSSWRCWGDLYIDKLEDEVEPFDDLDPKLLDCPGNTNPLPDSTIAQWNGSMKNHVRNIITPPVEIIDKGDGEYWQRADLRIVLNLNSAPAAIDFSAADLCPAGWPNAAGLVSPALFPIEVQTPSGAVDIAKTRQLLRFMCERRGAIFYNDIPTNPVTPPNNNTGVASNAASYSPPFANNQRVYRRVGEDTSGNGSLSNWDRNDDVCPAGKRRRPLVDASDLRMAQWRPGRHFVVQRHGLPPRRVLEPPRATVDVSAQHQPPRSHRVERVQRRPTVSARRHHRRRTRLVRHGLRSGLECRQQRLRHPHLRLGRSRHAQRHVHPRRPGPNRDHRGERPVRNHSGQLQQHRQVPRRLPGRCDMDSIAGLGSTDVRQSQRPQVNVGSIERPARRSVSGLPRRTRRRDVFHLREQPGGERRHALRARPEHPRPRLVQRRSSRTSRSSSRAGAAGLSTIAAPSSASACHSTRTTTGHVVRATAATDPASTILRPETGTTTPTSTRSRICRR